MSRRSRQEELRKVARGSEALYGGRGGSKDIGGGGTRSLWQEWGGSPNGNRDRLSSPVVFEDIYLNLTTTNAGWIYFVCPAST